VLAEVEGLIEGLEDLAQQEMVLNFLMDVLG
jgi:hypothetical protein